MDEDNPYHTPTKDNATKGNEMASNTRYESLTDMQFDLFLKKLTLDVDNLLLYNYNDARDNLLNGISLFIELYGHVDDRI